MDSQPHSEARLVDGEWRIGCWCGSIHNPDWKPIPESEWRPATKADLDALYLEAWLT